MAVSTTMMTQMKHRQLLYVVSTRLSRENLKDMMYLAVIDKELQQSVQSGTDFFNILEHKGLFSHQNYTHLISMLETIGRIDLIEIVFSGHQNKAAMFTSSACTFSVPEQLAYMKRAQILRKRERYLQCMQKLDGLVKYNTIYKDRFEVLFLQLLSVVQYPKIDPNHLTLEHFTQQRVGKLLSSASLCWKSAIEAITKLYRTGDVKGGECFEAQSHMCYKEFCTEMLIDEEHFVQPLQPRYFEGKSILGAITKDAYQSLQDVAIELFGKQDTLITADASLNNTVLKLEKHYLMTQYVFSIYRWLLNLIFAIENNVVNIDDIKDVVMVIASSHREGIVQAAEEVQNLIGQDSLEQLLHLFPSTKVSPTESENPERTLVLQSNGLATNNIVWYTCLILLVCAALPNKENRQQLHLKLVLPELRKAMINCNDKNTELNIFTHNTKLMVSNIHRETQLYKKECEQVILNLTSGSQKSADNFGSLFDLQS